MMDNNMSLLKKKIRKFISEFSLIPPLVWSFDHKQENEILMNKKLNLHYFPGICIVKKKHLLCSEIGQEKKAENKIDKLFSYKHFQYAFSSENETQYIFSEIQPILLMRMKNKSTSACIFLPVKSTNITEKII